MEDYLDFEIFRTKPVNGCSFTCKDARNSLKISSGKQMKEIEIPKTKGVTVTMPKTFSAKYAYTHHMQCPQGHPMTCKAITAVDDKTVSIIAGVEHKCTNSKSPIDRLFGSLGVSAAACKLFKEKKEGLKSEDNKIVTGLGMTFKRDDHRVAITADVSPFTKDANCYLATTHTIHPGVTVGVKSGMKMHKGETLKVTHDTKAAISVEPACPGVKRIDIRGNSNYDGFVSVVAQCPSARDSEIAFTAQYKHETKAIIPGMSIKIGM
ncbi:hypothetical protein J8273_3892 [Carpediemonas membranifera]|uniref:Uncharacterized protein n=1 Tax=Carpediemonas membranifera TaxID=201153 RepID=A0A8J6B314_9EUKA|nr:hypothetical protein J8273_3892 [Carpediemonas membranifera]|eukprot:KAG9394638.1 hypothetical protein J8273_3892 [Carpediemonas membranifera]